MEYWNVPFNVDVGELCAYMAEFCWLASPEQDQRTVYTPSSTFEVELMEFLSLPLRMRSGVPLLLPLLLLLLLVVPSLQFVPTLPAQTQHAAALRLRLRASPSPSSPSIPHLYLVDDEATLLTAVESYLTSVPYSVTTFSSGSHALEALTSEAAALPDLIVSDVNMPGLSGLELLRSIRSSPSPALSTVPVVLLTARGMTEDRIEGYKAGEPWVERALRGESNP